jgi:hypothetical protein
MKMHRPLWEKLRLLTGPEDPPDRATGGGSPLAQFAAPHTFNPNLSLGSALLAVAASLARVFGACVLFAMWGGLSVYVWSGIENHFWRAGAVAALVLLLLAAVAALMIAISLAERRIARKR